MAGTTTKKGYYEPDTTKWTNFNIVRPPEFVKILSNVGGYKYYVKDTGVNSDNESTRVSNGGHNGVAENYKGFYGSTRFYYGAGENDFYQGPPKDYEKSASDNLYVFD